MSIVEELKYLQKYVEPIEIRLKGRTTRLINNYIDEFFKNNLKVTCVRDHYPTRQMSLEVVRRIIDRLNFEHGLNKEYFYVHLDNDIEYTIEFKLPNED